MKPIILSSAMLLAVFSLPAVAAGDAEAGRAKATTCLGCHGIPDYHNVYPSYRVPKLGGQHAQYIVAALHEYRDSQRSHKTMHAQALSLSDQDMDDIAAWLETQTGK